MSASPRVAHPQSHLRVKAGFSLVEVTLALSIIGIAFVSLMGMLPVGMSIFKESRDTSNENWILQMLQAKVQATDWKKLAVTDTSNVYANEVYFYDVDGRFVYQQGGTGSGSDKNADKATYKVKIINGIFKRPEGTTSNTLANATEFAVVFVKVQDKPGNTRFNAINSMADLEKEPLPPGIRIRTFLVTKMDSI